MKRYFFIIVLVFFGLLGFVSAYHLPAFKEWFRQQIIVQTQDQQLHIIPQSIDFSIFPIGIYLYDLEIKPQKKLKRHISDFKIKRLSSTLNLASLFLGYLLIKEIRVEGMDIEVKTKQHFQLSSKGRKRKFAILKKEDFLKYLDQPISSIIFEKTQLRLDHPKGFMQWEDLSLKTDYRDSNWSLVIKSPNFSYQNEGMSKLESDWSFNTNLQLDKDNLFISSLHLAKQTDYLHLFSGHCSIEQRLDDCLKEYQFQWRSNLDLQKIQDWTLFFDPENNLAQIKGSLDASAQFVKNRQKTLDITLKASIQGFQLNRFYLGHVNLEIFFQENAFTFTNFTVLNKKNHFDLSEAIIQWDENFSFQVPVQIKSLELRQLLADFHIGPPPVHLGVQGQLPCEGQFLPQVQIYCQTGALKFNDFAVYSNKRKIAAFQNGQAQGDLVINQHQATIDSELTLGQSKGIVNGHVNYRSGFLFRFSTPRLHLSDIESLADLKFEGHTALRGLTRGNSKSATLSMNLKTKNIWFEDYGIGDFESTMQYRRGILSFQDVKGMFGRTTYQADLRVNLRSSILEAEMTSNHLELADLRQILQRKYLFPLKVQAIGTAYVKIWGPLEFHRLSYDLDLVTQKGVIAQESFDKLLFHVQARDGQFETKQAEIHKGLGLVTISSGLGYPDGQINMQIKGSNFYLEDSEILQDFGFNFFGQNNFNISLQGHVFKPEIKISGQIEGFRISDIPISTPHYNIRWSGEGIHLSGFLENQTLSLETLLPLDTRAPLFIKMDMNKWDFSPAFALLKQEGLVQEYETSISGKVDISSLSDWIWQADGFIQLDEIIMQRGQNNLYLKQPATIRFTDSKMNISNFILTGNNTHFEVEAKDSQKSHLNLSFNGKIDTYMIAFLTPFFEESRGLLELKYDLRGSTHDLEMMGSAYIGNGYAKLKHFPHPFENLRMEILFSEENIILTDFYTDLTTGNVTANGKIAIHSWKNFPTQISARAKDIQLHIPEGVQTRGDGQIEITGSWFPFLFKGEYTVNRARVEKEFEGEESDVSIRYSSLLPESLLKKRFSTIQWDISTSFKSNAHISNSFIEADFFGDLRLLGPLENPHFLGEIHFKEDGIFKFRDTPFKITKASLRFPNVQEVDPIVSLVANAQVKQYDINMSIQGTRKEHRIQFESSPTLPERDIISLITLGFRSERGSLGFRSEENLFFEEQSEQSNYEDSRILQQGANYVEQIIGVERATGLEVNFSSTKDESEDFEDIPKVTVKRQLGSKWSASVSRRLGSGIRSDLSNTDPERKSSASDAKIEYQLNNNFSVIGMWENQERYFLQQQATSPNENTDIDRENVFGLDLKYEIEFR